MEGCMYGMVWEIEFNTRSSGGNADGLSSLVYFLPLSTRYEVDASTMDDECQLLV